MSRQLLAFKRGPTVEIRIGDLGVLIESGREGRIHLEFGESSAYLSWDEWRDFSRRVDHALSWIEEHTPEDANGSSYEVSE
jgi:hypothetical protein